MHISLKDRTLDSAWRSMSGAAKGALLFVALVVVSQCIAACSQVALTGWQIVTARQKAFWFQADYRRVAAIVAQGPLRYADSDTVQYAPAKDGKSGGFASWDAAKVPPAVRDELHALFAAQRAQAVLIEGRRVNFVIRGLGLEFTMPPHAWGSPWLHGDSFDRVGVIVTSPDEPGCEALATAILMKRCEQLDGQTYFYLF
jgi:hypothetical protein